MLKLREIRKERGLTQKELADQVGVLNVSLSNYERGTQLPDIVTLAKIADVLGVTTDKLLGLDRQADHELPITKEAQILASGVDRLPKEQREQALNVVRAMFSDYAEYFQKGSEKDETES